MVHDGAHNPAVRLSDTGADSYGCADPNASAFSPAYPRADADTNSYATAGVNRYTDASAYADASTDTYMYSRVHSLRKRRPSLRYLCHEQ